MIRTKSNLELVVYFGIGCRRKIAQSLVFYQSKYSKRETGKYDISSTLDHGMKCSRFFICIFVICIFVICMFVICNLYICQLFICHFYICRSLCSCSCGLACWYLGYFDICFQNLVLTSTLLS